MSAIIFQIQAIRKLCRQRWLATDDLAAAAASLKELAVEVNRTLINRRDAEAAIALEKGDWK
jgi:hypothetical protein